MIVGTKKEGNFLHKKLIYMISRAKSTLWFRIKEIEVWLDIGGLIS
jgi:hypothetical protein